MALPLDLEAALGAIEMDLKEVKKSKTVQGKMKNTKNMGSRSENGKLRSRMAYRETVAVDTSGECGAAVRSGQPVSGSGGGVRVFRRSGSELGHGASMARRGIAGEDQ